MYVVRASIHREKKYDMYMPNNLYHVTDSEAESQFNIPTELQGSAIVNGAINEPLMTSSQGRVIITLKGFVHVHVYTYLHAFGKTN